MKKISIIVIALLIFMTACSNSNSYSEDIKNIRDTKFAMLGEEYNVGDYLDYILNDAKWSEDDDYTGDRGTGMVKVTGIDKHNNKNIEIVWVKNTQNAREKESRIDYIMIDGKKEDNDAMAYSTYIQYLEKYKNDLEKQS